MMTSSNILCLLCGSLISCLIFFAMTWRQTRLDARLIRHVRRNAYMRGWSDGKDAAWRSDA